MRIETSLESLHHANRFEAQFVDEALLLAESDAVFAGACAFLIRDCKRGSFPVKEANGKVTISSARSTMLCTTCSTRSLSLGSWRL